MATQHSIGQLVLIHDPQLAESLGRAGETAVVLQRRRGGARIGFLSDGGNAWVEDRRLYALDGAPAGAPLLAAVSTALKCLPVEEVSFESVGEEGVRLEARCLAFDAENLAELQEQLGRSLVSWAVAPYGMAVIVLNLELRRN
jgi:hypothetical protein